MSGWETWCDQALVPKGTNKVVGAKAGIFCRVTGAPWGIKPATFSIPPATVLDIVKILTTSDARGVEMPDGKYMFLKHLEDDGIKYAMFKHGQCGLTCALGNRSVIIGMYEEGMQAGAHTAAVFNTMQGLKAQDY